ncbi:MAG: hypothetical protein AB1327_00835 [Bacillota bacterium]
MDFLRDVFLSAYFYRHLAASFLGVLAGFLLSLALHRRHERKAAKHARDMYLLALKAELSHNLTLLRQLTIITENSGRSQAFYELANLRAFYSLIEGITKGLRQAAFDGVMKNGMLGLLGDDLVSGILQSYAAIDSAALEIQASQAWLAQGPGEEPDAWLARKKGIIGLVHDTTLKAASTTESCLAQIAREIPDRLPQAPSAPILTEKPHFEIHTD